MSRRPHLAILVSSLVILHLFLHLGLGIGKAAPDLMTVALLLAAREFRMGAGAALGSFFGLLEDSFSTLAFGANTLSLTLLGILGSRTRDLFVGESVVFFLAYLGAGKLLRDLIHWLVAGQGGREPFLTAVAVDGMVGAAYSAALGILVLLAFYRKGAFR